MWSPTELQALAELVLGGPVFLRKQDKKVVAVVESIRVQKPCTFYLQLKISDRSLALNIKHKDYVERYFTLLDPVECILVVPH